MAEDGELREAVLLDDRQGLLSVFALPAELEKHAVAFAQAPLSRGSLDLESSGIQRQHAQAGRLPLRRPAIA